MKGPAREPDDGPSEDGPLHYAPKKVRHPGQEPIPLGAQRESEAAQNGAPESGSPPWKRSKRHGPFAGDVAIVELRNKLTLVPHQLPEPPLPPSTSVRYRLAIRLAGIVVVTAVGAVGYRLGSVPAPSQLQLALRSSLSNQEGAAVQGSVPATHPLQSAALSPTSPPEARATVWQSYEQKTRDAAPSRAVSAQLTVGAVQPRKVDEAVSLTLSATAGGANGTVVIGGLAPGSTLSAGTQVGPGTWRLPVAELAGAAISPPRGFVGAVDLALELRLADNTVADRKSLRLEWSGVAAKAQPRRLDASEIAQMVKTGTEYMANGSVGAARMMLQPAAEAGDAGAAFALAETYDPLVLKKLNAVGGITADVGLAQTWYQKAKEFGSAAAPERIERLARARE